MKSDGPPAHASFLRLEVCQCARIDPTNKYINRSIDQSIDRSINKCLRLLLFWFFYCCAAAVSLARLLAIPQTGAATSAKKQWV